MLYRRLGDVPGLAYAPPEGLDRSALPWADLQPSRLEALSLPDTPPSSDDDRYFWDYGDYSSSQSPAKRYWEDGLASAERPTDIRRQLYGALELPGTLSDYHFILLGAAETLYSRARREPSVLSLVEEVCKLDVRVVALDPTLFSWVDDEGKLTQYRVPAFSMLARLYRSEAALPDWLAIEERAAALSQGDPDAARAIIAELQGDIG